MAKEQSQPCLIPGCQKKKESPGPSPCRQTASSPPWSDIPWESGVCLCKGLSLSSTPQPLYESKSWCSSSPGCATQHPLVKTPSARLLRQYSNGANEAAQENKHQMEWRSRVRKKQKLCGLQTPQNLSEKMG